MGMRQIVRHHALALAMGLILLGPGASVAQQQGEAPPPAVETAAVTLAPVTRATSFVGTVAAIQQVDLIARVEGFIKSRDFDEGSFVKAGSLLFQIEKDTYQAALEGAQATLAAAQATKAGAEANLTQAELNLNRQKQLVRSSAVSQATVDQATATRDTAAAQVKSAEAQIAQAEAQVKSAELNLSYTDITAPISGRIGKANFTVGNLVSPTSGALATIVQTDPIRVVFAISDRDYLQAVKQLNPTDQGFGNDASRYQPKLQLPDGTTYAQAGKITFIDNKVDPSTGTIAVYAEFPNPKLQLVPGQYVTVTVAETETRMLPVVPAAAVLQDRDGNYVFVLGEGNRATIRRITLGDRVGTDWSASSGLAQGDVVIVSGVQKVRPGIVVAPHPAEAAK